ncbi:DapH/DapD/GlmU-related protein [Phenylobacterium sp.]|uniref:acyltransferase n=1 Tax=Phenylobacterium sp. TaxID=1871053 RepID=UPI0025D2E531|nr:DapH/DapD/GlmU-related protein [Phenylobacterium sp.]
MKNHLGRFLREDRLRELGAAAVGENVAVHETCVLVDLENMRFGSNVRIDPFCMLSAAGGWLTMGDFVHVATHVFVTAGSGVELCDFVGLSPGVRVFSRSDDFTGEYLTNPTVPATFTKPPALRPVRVGRHVVVGAGTVILPEVDIGDGSTVGAGSVVTRSLDPWGIYVGSPARRVRDRSQGLLAVEARFRASLVAGEVVLPVSRL